MFYDRFVELCKTKRMSPAAVARDIGLSNSSTTTWKRGAIPKGETLQKLADYFGVSVDYLLGKYHLKGAHSAESFDVLNQIFMELKRNGMSYEEFCKKLGLPFDEWFHWKEGSSESYLDYLPQIASILNISESQLGRAYRKTIVSVETRLRRALVKLNDDGQHEAVKRVEELTEIPKYQRTTPQEGGESTPPAREGKDTTPSSDAPETPPEGE